MEDSGFNPEWLFIELINILHYLIKLNCTVIDQLCILQKWSPNTPEPFQAVFPVDSAEMLPGHFDT
jgi:hypothetical protein